MSEINVFRQDTQPTGRKEGDIWLGNGTGSVYMCTDVPGNVWTRLASSPNSTTTPELKVLTDTCTRASFTDGGSTLGTRIMAGVLPVGAWVIATVLSAVTGFIGDTSATVTVGDGGGDVDRYMTGTPSLFTTAAYVECGIPSGVKLIQTAVSPTIHVTSNSDFTLVTAGSVTVSIFYLMTA